MGKPLRVLIVEDSQDDVLLMIRELRKGGYDPVYERVEDAGDMRDALHEKAWDVILSDYRMPQFSAPAAIALLKEAGIDIPLIIVSGAIGEETAVACMRSGARDYVIKGNLSRLGPAVERELRDAESRRQRNQAQDALRESEEKYRTLVETTRDLIYTTDRKGSITYMNPTFVRTMGYIHDEWTGKSFGKLVAPECIDSVRDIFARAMRGESIPVYEVDLIREDGTRLSVEFNVSTIYDNEGKTAGRYGLGRDITERKRMEDELHLTLESLRKAFGATIQVMVSAVETRDPYTAGHQVRSADLARAIAVEVGLPQEKIDGIRMAGSIHDIGKLSVPAEILSKPTKLSALEFSLIKEHARKGYEMLKDVESPWPLAEIVYQHHERMDGSGYPRKLKGDEILTEARIMAVADVVESMASHRPYRPALGIEAALEEISKNKGVLYDAGAADACRKLFEEKRYRFT